MRPLKQARLLVPKGSLAYSVTTLLLAASLTSIAGLTAVPTLPCQSQCCTSWCNSTYAGACGRECCKSYLIHEDVCRACLKQQPQCTFAPSPVSVLPEAGTALVGFTHSTTTVNAGVNRVALTVSLTAAPDFLSSDVFLLFGTADPSPSHTAQPSVLFDATAQIVHFDGLAVERSAALTMTRDVYVELVPSGVRFNESFKASLQLARDDSRVRMTQREAVVVLQPVLLPCKCHTDCGNEGKDHYCLKGPPHQGEQVCAIPGQCLRRDMPYMTARRLPQFQSAGGGSCCENAGDCNNDEYCNDNAICEFFDDAKQYTCAREKDSNFPQDAFTCKQKRHGAAVLHCLGVLYVFAALAIVCDDYFVPALEVLVDTYSIKDDVAGATFMAAGGSAPELFTSVMGVFVAKSDVGFGTIVGSAVFNILLVIGACSFCAGKPLELTWWPLMRDSCWYLLAIATLYLLVTNDNSAQIKLTSQDDAKVRNGLISEPLTVIVWWEALVLLGIYVGYVTFMYFNEHIEEWVKNVIKRRNQVNKDPLKRLESEVSAKSAAPVDTGNGGTDADLKPPEKPPEKLPPVVTKKKMGEGGGEAAVDLKPDDGGAACLERSSPSGGWMDINDSDDRAVNDDDVNGMTEVVRMTPRCTSDAPSTALPAVGEENETEMELPAIKHDLTTTVIAATNSKSNFVAGRTLSVRQMRNSARMTVRLEAKSKHLLEKMRQAEHQLVEHAKDFIHHHQPPLVGPLAHIRASSTTPEPDMHEQPVRESMSVSMRNPAEYPTQMPSQNIVEAPEGRPMEELDAPPDKWYEMPEETSQKIQWAVFLPVNMLFALTIPDCRFEERKKWFAASFIISILWIAFYSYWMVWWVTEVSAVLKVPVTVAGVTVLAAGTSVPDLITSVIVARRGLGDMAVSSSIGSNIFDLCMGLPLPWAISNMIVEPIKGGKFGETYTRIGTDAMEFSLFMLFALLAMTVLTIIAFGWKIGKPMGIFCTVMYIIFITLTILAQTKTINVDFKSASKGCGG